MSVVGRKDGEKRTGTYLDLHSFAAAAAAALKLMATRWHLMAGDATLSLRIPFNTIKEDIGKLAVSNF